jgi:pSer/pThr/pTyr-binding forkhead associated (FHA) protein
MGSENGTTINGKRVSEHFLADGDLIQIGAQRFLFRS